jgi:hypothetical protein
MKPLELRTMQQQLPRTRRRKHYVCAGLGVTSYMAVKQEKLVICKPAVSFGKRYFSRANGLHLASFESYSRFISVEDFVFETGFPIGNVDCPAAHNNAT